MINDGTPQENFLGQIIRGQIDFLLAMLARPVVQQQLLVILAILLVGLMFPAQVTILPIYLGYARVGLINQPIGLAQLLPRVSTPG